jgi:hypothetical protein
METIPVKIRPHLIPFLFKEMEGTEAAYMTQRVKTLKIYPFSSIGKFLFSHLPDFQQLGKMDQFIIYLTVEKKSFNIYEGFLYVNISKVTEKVYLPETKVNDINNLLEDIFRIAYVYYVDGYLEHKEKANVTKAVNSFIDKYDLLEFGMSDIGMRRLYYREKNKDNKISRMQYMSSTRVTNFDTKPS